MQHLQKTRGVPPVLLFPTFIPSELRHSSRGGGHPRFPILSANPLPRHLPRPGRGVSALSFSFCLFLRFQLSTVDRRSRPSQDCRPLLGPSSTGQRSRNSSHESPVTAILAAASAIINPKRGIFRMTDARSIFATVEEAVEEIRQGRMIVLVDDEDRENEGDLAMAAEKITPEATNFIAKHGRDRICLPLTEERCDELHLPLLSPTNTPWH